MEPTRDVYLGGPESEWGHEALRDAATSRRLQNRPGQKRVGVIHFEFGVDVGDSASHSGFFLVRFGKISTPQKKRKNVISSKNSIENLPKLNF